MALGRLYDFTPGTPITSAEVDAEFNQLCNLLNGTSTDVDTILTLSHATNSVLTLNQTGAGPIFIVKKSGTEKARFNTDGVLQLGTTTTPGATSRLMVNSTSTAAAVSVQGDTSTTILADFIAHASASNNLTIWRTSLGSPSDIRVSILNSGKIRTLAGYGSTAPTGSGSTIVIGGCLTAASGSTGNVGSGEDDLFSYTLAANVLAADGDFLEIKVAGETAANGNNKQIKAYFAGTSIFATGVVTWNAKDWVGNFQLIRAASDTLRIVFEFNNEDGSFTNYATATIGSQNFATTNIIKMTGEAVSNDDIVQKTMTIKKHSV